MPNHFFTPGQISKARGDRRGRRDKYWTVARFGQVIDSQGRTGFEHWMGTTLQAMAYRQLQASSEKEGNQAEAALFGYLAAKFDPAQGRARRLPGGSAFGLDTPRRNAAVVEISGLMILVFFRARGDCHIDPDRRQSPRRAARAQRARPVATMVVLTSAVGLLFSSVTLYLTYRPYWYIFQSAILNGDRNQARDLRYFLYPRRCRPAFHPASTCCWTPCFTPVRPAFCSTSGRA